MKAITSVPVLQTLKMQSTVKMSWIFKGYNTPRNVREHAFSIQISSQPYLFSIF